MSKFSSSSAVGHLVIHGEKRRPGVFGLRVGRRVLKIHEVPDGFIAGDKVEARWVPDNERWEFFKGDKIAEEHI